MQTVLIVIHLMIVLAMVAVVLLQRSEGGGLGIGGGGGNMMSSRSSGNALTKITGALAFAFFVTSLSLGILARYDQGPTSILDRIETQTEGSGQGILDQLGGASSSGSAPEAAPAEDGSTPAAPEGSVDQNGSDAAPDGDIPGGDQPSPSEIPTGQ